MLKQPFKAAALALLSIASSAHAGGYQISVANFRPLLDAENWASINYSNIRPNVISSLSNRSVVESFNLVGAYAKVGLADGVDAMLEYHTPFRSTLNYGDGDLKLSLDSRAYVLSGRVAIANGVSAILGYHLIDITSLRGSKIGFTDGLTAVTSTELGARKSIRSLSYGLSYEYKPMALKLLASLQGNRKFDLTLNSTLTGGTTGTITAQSRTPTSTLISAEMGLTSSTLLSASYLNENWSKSDINIDQLGGAALTNFTKSSSLQLGLTQRIMPGIALSGRLSFAPKSSGTADKLSPINGSTSVGLGLSYYSDNYYLNFGAMSSHYGGQTVPHSDGSDINITSSSGTMVGIEGKVKIF